MSTRTRQDGNGDEPAHECEIKDDPDPSQPLGTALLEHEFEKHRDEGVGHSGGENTLDGAI